MQSTTQLKSKLYIFLPKLHQKLAYFENSFAAIFCGELAIY